MEKTHATIVPEFLQNGRFGHIQGVLDQEPPWILRKLIPILSANVQIDDATVQKIKDISRLGPVVYAMKYRSLYDLHLLRIRFHALGLPLPAFIFGISSSASASASKLYKIWRSKLSSLFDKRKRFEEVDENVLREILESGGAAVFFLVDEKTSSKIYVRPEHDPIRIILNIQGKIGACISIIPMMILYDRTPRRVIRPFWESFLGDPDRPGPFKRLLIRFRKWTVPELLVGEPIHSISQLEEFGAEKSWEDLPHEIRKELVEAVNARIRVNRGPEKLSRTEIKERVLQDARVQRAVRETAQKEAVTEKEIRLKAGSYIDEIAADPRIQVHHFLYHSLKWIFSKIFDGIDSKNSEFAVLKETNEKGPLIFVSSHKSHFDYLIVGFLTFVNQMAIPYIAAGKNLSFWPVGPIFRHGGAFFIRRSFKGLALYTHVFAAYLKVLIKENVNINFYIEGGRSRTGKLMPPRIGMLGFLLQAVEEGEVNDLFFVPTYIGYDQIPEEKSYLHELAGREKEKESFIALLRAREVLKKKFGKVYVRFHKPLSFKEFCSKSGVEFPGVNMRENRKVLLDFAYYLMTGIANAAVVTPIELVAAGLVCSGLKKIDSQRLSETIDYLVQALNRRGIELAESFECAEKVTARSLELFRSRRFIEVETSQGATSQVYTINEQRRPNLEFYKNALVNHLWPESFASIALLCHDNPVYYRKIEEEFQLLLTLSSKELITDPLKSPEQLLKEVFSFFEKENWIEFLNDDLLRIQDRKPFMTFKGIMSDLLQVYYLALVTTTAMEKDETVGQKDFAKRMVRTASEMAHNGSFVPTISSVTLSNALTRLSEMGILRFRSSKKVLAGVSDPHERDRLKEFLSCVWPFSDRDVTT